MKPICDFIVLTWNKVEVTRSFIDSFLANTSLPSRLIIIDNASSDGTRAYLSSLQETSKCKIKLIFNEENKGFVKGMNQGIEISEAPYVCLTNNDILVTKGWLEEVISVFQKHEDVGMLNPSSNTLGVCPKKGISLDIFAEGLKRKYRGLFAEMPFCVGFCMFIKREVINKVGLLSEDFFPMFFEDTDYSARVKKSGYLIGYAKGSYVWHQEHASFKSWKMSKRDGIFKNNRNVFIKKQGKILRIAWIVDNYQELLANLEKAVALAREGNYIWFLVKNFNQEREKVFQETGIREHCGVNFVKANNNINLLWIIFIKKKKYDVIIDNRFFRRQFLRHHTILKNFGRYNVFSHFDKKGIEKIKYFRD